MSRRIFLADDSVTIQKVIELTFSDGDYEVQSVSNGDEALAALPKADPDFIILDVHMPGANGYEVCRRAKQSNPGIPVLLLVGTFEPFDEGHARSCGADSILKKPFDSQELLERVEELLAARQDAPPAPIDTAPAAAQPASAAAPTQEMPVASFPAAFAAPAAMPSPPFQAVPQPPPAMTPEPSWSGFDLAPEPEAPSFEAPSVSPYDREPSFVLDADPDYPAPAEPVFSFEDREPALTFAPEEPAEAPAPAIQDRFLAEPEVFSASEVSAAPAWTPVPEPADLAEPELELELPDEPLLPAWTEPPAPVATAYVPFTAPEAAPAPPQAADALDSTAPAILAPAAHEPQAHHANGRLSDEEVERIAHRVVSLLGDKAVREIAWEVVPDLAEVIIRDRLRDLEGQVETL